MVRINFLCHEPFLDQADPIFRSIPYLKDHGISIKSNTVPAQRRYWPEISEQEEEVRQAALTELTRSAIDDKPDVILCYHRTITPLLLSSNVPLIILEHSDAPALEISRYLIHLDSVIGVIKGSVFTDPAFYNGPFCEGMYHGVFINEGLPVVYNRLPDIQKHLHKVELGYSFGAFGRNKRFLSQGIKEKRDINVSFVGATDYGRSRLITRHRKNAAEQVAKAGGFVGNNIPFDEFDRVLFSSYSCASPYGYGVCFRSFEGLYSGTSVIQPDSSFMKSWPNVFIPECYVLCSCDFSDLAEKVEFILDSWNSFSETRFSNRELLVNHYWTDLMGNHLKGIFERCLKRVK